MGATSVVAWNGSATSRAALLWALDREQSGSGGLLLLTVIDEVFQGCGQAAMDELRVAAEQALDAELAWIRRAAPAVVVSAAVLEGDPEKELLQSCPPGSTLVVGQRAPHEPFRRWSLAARLASQAAVPVVIVRPGSERDRSGVVVGVDGSKASKEASLFAAGEALRRHDSLHAVHAWLEKTRGPVSEAFERDDLLRHQLVLDETVKVLQDTFPALRIQRHLDTGAPASVLMRHAPKAALLVVGSRGHGPVKQFLLGSVSSALILTADCPLAIVTEGRTEGRVGDD
jgi:nucleotide-binding universal stress UspA family protein